MLEFLFGRERKEEYEQLRVERMDDTNEIKDIDSDVDDDDDDLNKPLWKTFSPELESRLSCVKTFLRNNMVPVSVSVAMVMCYLLLRSKRSKFKVTPYSDLLKGLRDGTVTRVQLRENSRCVVYDSVPRISESAKVLNQGSSPILKFQKMLASMVGNLLPKHDIIPGLYHSQIVADKKNLELVASQLPKHGWQFSTRYIDDDYRELLNLMKEKGTTYALDPEPFVVSAGRRVCSTLLSQAPSWAMLSLVARGLGGGGGGSSIARKPSKNDMVTFDDVQGVDEAKAELMEIVSCLQGDSNYALLGAKIPRGVLLVGPPGTGKTLLARAVAEKAGVPFFITCASEFVEMFVGRGASRIRNLFKEARKHAPSIIFIDELDAVGLKRGRGFNTEGDQTLNQLLTEMDGFESDKKVVVIAATNRPEMLDSALLRAGRFSRKVFVKEPDEEGRKKILAVHFRDVPLKDDRDDIFNLVASLTPGLVGADLANIVNEAALLAARRGGVCVSRDDVMKAVERAKVSFGDRQQQQEFSEKEAQEIYSISNQLLARSKLDF
uniref:probable inactive ATP-dependent zinc metalloprotease FTSHI 3, chloroplastic n=1 Tax=Erigeron canadensis TaxID=72917 RepID=UPI001CB8FF38|nr:probable inactive ATP-dependent zinc metalloprotease FTSHI 3, chloroplastic [Erigeron canadensis]XP_043613946.1 probable inactive ATP-dependent zinc metalloprotease FTSHI 3, chloroplastic [Erigeron canadensis]